MGIVPKGDRTGLEMKRGQAFPSFLAVVPKWDAWKACRGNGFQLTIPAAVPKWDSGHSGNGAQVLKTICLRGF